MAFKVSLVTWIAAFFVFALPLGSNGCELFGQKPGCFLLSYYVCATNPSHPHNTKNKPRCSMYDLFTYIWVVLGVNLGK